MAHLADAEYTIYVLKMLISLKKESFIFILVTEAQRGEVIWPRSAAELVFLKSATLTKRASFLLWTNIALRVLYELDNPHGYLLFMFRVNTQRYGIKGCTIALLDEKEKPTAFAKWQV